MPWKVKLYPKNWDELARACKEQANWRCEHCGVAHGTERVGGKRGNAYRVRIAAAHRYHDPANPEPCLIALCQRCHLKYDRHFHGRNARRTHYRKIRESMIIAGQLLLFPVEEIMANALYPEGFL